MAPCTCENMRAIVFGSYWNVQSLWQEVEKTSNRARTVVTHKSSPVCRQNIRVTGSGWNNGGGWPQNIRWTSGCFPTSQNPQTRTRQAAEWIKRSLISDLLPVNKTPWHIGVIPLNYASLLMVLVKRWNLLSDIKPSVTCVTQRVQRCTKQSSQKWTLCTKTLGCSSWGQWMRCFLCVVHFYRRFIKLCIESIYY